LNELNSRTPRELDLPPTTQGVLEVEVDPSSAAAEAGLRRGGNTMFLAVETHC
jgi:hypothetical protein